MSTIAPFAGRANTKKRGAWLATGLLGLVAACTHIPPGDVSPDRVWASPRKLEDATACVITALDRYRRAGTSQNIRHSAQAIVPGKVNEVRPAQEFALPATAYYVRLERTADQITRITLFARTASRRPLMKVVRGCGE